MATRLVLILLLLVACGGPQESQRPDHEIYRAAIGPAKASIAERLVLCNQLGNWRSQGDCGVWVIINAAREKHPEPELFCEQIAAGAWRFECFFEMAEYWRRKKDLGRAVRLCEKAGPFQKDCGQHMWQSEVRGLAKGAKDLPSIMPQADALFAKWGVFFKKNDKIYSGFIGRFWRHLFQIRLEPMEKIDLAACKSLKIFHQKQCILAGGYLYLRRVQQIVRHDLERSAFCDLSEGELGSILTGSLNTRGYEASYEPIFVTVLGRVYDHICVEELPLPVRFNLITTDVDGVK